MNILIDIIILLLAIPVGFLIAWLCRDELIEGRVWFRILIIVGVLGGLWFYLTGNTIISLALFFIAIVAFISYIKSNDKKFAVKRKY